MAVVEDNEKRFEEDIESYLLSHGGYIKGTQDTYDREKAISVSTLIAYLEETQANEWRKYKSVYPDKTAEHLVKRLNEQIGTNGLVHVLRNGIVDRGVRLKVASFRPETSLNATVVRDYHANKLEVVRQFHYSTENNNSIDMVLLLNGLPVVALELKNQIKGKTVDNEKKQFKYKQEKRET